MYFSKKQTENRYCQNATWKYIRKGNILQCDAESVISVDILLIFLWIMPPTIAMNVIFLGVSCSFPSLLETLSKVSIFCNFMCKNMRKSAFYAHNSIVMNITILLHLCLVWDLFINTQTREPLI